MNFYFSNLSAEKKPQDNRSGINSKSSVRIIQYVKHHIEDI